MARKTGVPTLLNLSKKACIYLDKFAPGLHVLYAGNAALLAALTAAEAACSVLAVELQKVREVEQYD